LPLSDDVTLRLTGRETVWESVAQMLGHPFGSARQFVRPLTHRAAKHLVEVRRASVTDVSTRPTQWFTTDFEQLRKTDFAQRASSNEGLRSCDPVYDLAEAAAGVEAAGMPVLSELLRSDYETLTGERVPPERWLLYRLSHHERVYREALSKAADESEATGVWLEAALEAERTMAAVHRPYVADVYLSDLTPATIGPLFAIDIDGVLEVRWMTFPAIGPTGALALRALNVHGYRAVLATGRSLEEVRERCHDYRLPGGVAEYGSVVYDHLLVRERSLIDAADRTALNLLRQELARRPDVYVDRAYRHSVRAHTLSSLGERTALAEGTISQALAASGTERTIRAVQGALQTDFVAAHVDKGHGLRALADLLGESADRRYPVAAAIGDSVSDVPVLKLAARAFTPANSSREVSRHARRLRRSYQSALLEAVGRELGHTVGRCRVCRAPRFASSDARLLLTALAALDGGKGRKIAQALSLAARVTRT
jgi:hydroxymethylpyrimidine pyrophosphatase-like HAD family hydrolase